MISVVIYHASWCRHCIDFNSNWGEITNRVKSMKKDGVLARVEEKDVGFVDGDSTVNGFPSIVIYEGGVRKPHMYEGSRDPNSFILFLKGIFHNSKYIKPRKAKKVEKAKKAKKAQKAKKAKKAQKAKKAKKAKKKSVKRRKSLKGGKKKTVRKSRRKK
mgnify:CR=1 FL=1